MRSIIRFSIVSAICKRNSRLKRRRNELHTKFVRNGFIYLYHRTMVNTIHYRCDQYPNGCRWRLSLNTDIQFIRYLKEEHNGHNVDINRCEVAALVNKMRNRAESTLRYAIYLMIDKLITYLVHKRYRTKHYRIGKPICRATAVWTKEYGSQHSAMATKGDECAV